LAQTKCCHCGQNHPTSYRGREVIKVLQKLRNKKNKSKQQMKTNTLVRIVPNNEPQTTQAYKKTYSQAVSNNTSAAKHTRTTENMLAQIMQMLKDQNRHLNKIVSSIKMT
jgi:uncharacterized membrane protein YheB (UPF0754 family)